MTPTVCRLQFCEREVAPDRLRFSFYCSADHGSEDAEEHYASPRPHDAKASTLQPLRGAQPNAGGLEYRSAEPAPRPQLRLVKPPEPTPLEILLASPADHEPRKLTRAERYTVTRVALHEAAHALLSLAFGAETTVRIQGLDDGLTTSTGCEGDDFATLSIKFAGPAVERKVFGDALFSGSDFEKIRGLGATAELAERAYSRAAGLLEHPCNFAIVRRIAANLVAQIELCAGDACLPLEAQLEGEMLEYLAENACVRRAG